jgi:hypothetical protein
MSQKQSRARHLLPIISQDKSKDRKNFNQLIYFSNQLQIPGNEELKFEITERKQNSKVAEHCG